MCAACVCVCFSIIWSIEELLETVYIKCTHINWMPIGGLEYIPGEIISCDIKAALYSDVSSLMEFVNILIHLDVEKPILHTLIF